MQSKINLILFLFILNYSEQALFEDINQINLNLYAKSKQLDFNNLTYLMINGDSPSLYINGTLVDYQFNMTKNTTYEALKEISHLSLSIISQFGNRCNHKLSDDQISDFELLKTKMYTMFAGILTDSLIPDHLRLDQIKFVKESIKIVENMLEKEKFDCADLGSYAAVSKPILDENIYQAALSQLMDLDGLMRNWLQKYNFVNWDKIYVLLCSSHMPKNKHIFVQYFQNLLSVGFEGDRLVYAETSDDEVCRDLLKTHITDKLIGTNLFNEPMRMHRDLLADAAAQIIPQMNSVSPLPNSSNKFFSKLHNFCSVCWQIFLKCN
ncbi:hypothetical protein BpHYR1_002165 [Brachionus plicatilis]|uniref:Uncharacterized protein n=1 Tax=Brachionus plicatilis TaxID=10195 RepID=A0A3M7QAH3_BRAPC|nr:hypothetical protein BpHYR1_002165 [Brachionus plicatilis]